MARILAHLKLWAFKPDLSHSSIISRLTASNGKTYGLYQQHSHRVPWHMVEQQAKVCVCWYFFVVSVNKFFFELASIHSLTHFSSNYRLPTNSVRSKQNSLQTNFVSINCIVEVRNKVYNHWYDDFFYEWKTHNPACTQFVIRLQLYYTHLTAISNTMSRTISHCHN